MNTEHATVIYSGCVQGVGFRFACRRLAMGFSVTGYVKNLPNGRVELAVEGDRPEIEEFLKAIEEGDLKPFIRQRTLEWKSASGNWRDFHIAVGL